jgi:RNA polymerase subunit RPABC4/transcription elongation factor Spt4
MVRSVVSFCGNQNCKRQYDEDERRCPRCGKELTNWSPDTELENVAIARWQSINNER